MISVKGIYCYDILEIFRWPSFPTDDFYLPCDSYFTENNNLSNFDPQNVILWNYIIIKILFDYLWYNTCRNYTKLYLNLQITEKWNVFLTGKDITDELVQLSSSVSNRNKRAVDSPWEGLAGVDTSYDPQVCIDNGLINPHLN